MHCRLLAVQNQFSFSDAMNSGRPPTRRYASLIKGRSYGSLPHLTRLAIGLSGNYESVFLWPCVWFGGLSTSGKMYPPRARETPNRGDKEFCLNIVLEDRVKS